MKNIRNKKHKRSRKPSKKDTFMQDPIKRQEEIARNEYDWMSQLNMRGGPSNKNAIPFDQNISVDPERTLAFIQSICKFAKKNTQL